VIEDPDDGQPTSSLPKGRYDTASAKYEEAQRDQQQLMDGPPSYPTTASDQTLRGGSEDIPMQEFRTTTAEAAGRI
jgi:hypothetical protein